MFQSYHLIKVCTKKRKVEQWSFHSTSFEWRYGKSCDLHKNIFFAVFWLELDLEAGGGDLTRVLPVLQVLLFFLTIRWSVWGSWVLHLTKDKSGNPLKLPRNPYPQIRTIVYDSLSTGCVQYLFMVFLFDSTWFGEVKRPLPLWLSVTLRQGSSNVLRGRRRGGWRFRRLHALPLGLLHTEVQSAIFIHFNVWFLQSSDTQNISVCCWALMR